MHFTVNNWSQTQFNESFDASKVKSLRIKAYNASFVWRQVSCSGILSSYSTYISLSTSLICDVLCAWADVLSLRRRFQHPKTRLPSMDWCFFFGLYFKNLCQVSLSYISVAAVGFFICHECDLALDLHTPSMVCRPCHCQMLSTQ